ncbi:MAG: ParB/RepB/Spo0J family partition protein [Spirochaetia bacterium]|jgi:ParB family chromosome partitioning protein
MSKKALGKGIGALLGDDEKIDVSSVAEVPLSALQPNPQQPRHDFDDATLKELADSIREKGVLQPILAEAGKDGAYIIIAGERRVRAARLAGLSKIPVVVRQFSAQEKLEIALIENVQREDLTPIEEALAYRRLMEMADLSQEQIAVKVGKDRSTIANTLRLLKLPDDAREALSSGAINAGHARALLMVVNPADQQVLLRRVVEDGISVRDAEKMAAALNAGKKGAGKSGTGGRVTPPRGEPELRSVEQKLIEKLGTKVEIRGSGKKGRIEISYFSTDDLERLLELLS